VLVKGGDWPIEEIVGREEVEAAGGQVLSLPFVEGSSTTDIIKRIVSHDD
jgi:D-beta-D-heptose 7-phosphate kinase/D-beta-D-heptose 1-phosphate adenosyltransferase